MRYTMRIVLLTAVVCAAGGMLTSKAEAVPISIAVLIPSRSIPACIGSIQVWAWL